MAVLPITPTFEHLSSFDLFTDYPFLPALRGNHCVSDFNFLRLPFPKDATLSLASELLGTTRENHFCYPR